MAKILNFKGEYEGLKTSVADKKLSMYGENIFRDTTDKSFKLYQSFLSPSFLALVLSFAVYVLLLGNILAGIACIFIGAVHATVTAFAQKYCNDKIGARKYSSEMKYRIVRDGELVLLPARYIVPDDIVIIQGGEMVPADAHILETANAFADESRFTGDNTPVAKRPGADSKNDEIKETCIYAGTRILSGSLVARVFATGEDTLRVRVKEKQTKRSDPDYTEYEKTANKVSILITACGLFAALLAYLFKMLLSADFSIAVGVITAISCFMCFIPPCVGLFIRLYDIIGAKKIESKGASFKNMGVIEKLNSLTAVVIDKTYVVTPNKLEVAGIYTKNRELMQNVTVLACERETSDPIEQAFLLDAALAGRDIKSLQSNEVIKSYHYNDDDRIGGNLCNLYGQRLLCIKGSPDKILTMCNIDADALFDIQQRIAALAKRGLELWASAYAILPEEADIPDSLYRIRYTYMGIAAFMSATRDVIPLAVQACRRAGVKVIMTTPDSPETAASMGKKIGLREEGMITGNDISEAVYLDRALDYTGAEIFAQVTAAQKLEIINGLQKAGEKVAVASNSDSQFDAVKAADLGITSLNSTTGSIYEVSGLVMADDSFGSIVEVIREARQIRHNIKKCLSLFISAIAAMALFAIGDLIFSMGVTTPMLVSSIMLVVVPFLGLGYSRNTADIKSEMTSSEFIARGVVNKRFFLASIVSGAIIGICAVIYTMFCLTGVDKPAGSASALIFITISLGMLSLFISSKKTPLITLIKEKNIPGKSVGNVFIIAACAIILPFIPFVSAAFGFSAPGIVQILSAIAVAIVINIWIEIRKYFR